MSGEEDRCDQGHPRNFGVIRSPGSGVGRSEDEHDSIGTTQTSGGLAAGDPTGGPQRTPERRAFDEARDEEPHVRSGHDPDLQGEAHRESRADDQQVTPPHGDELGDD